MQIINTNNLNEARKQIEKLRKTQSNELIAILGQDDEFNRKALEIKGLNFFIINEEFEKRDYSKQRNSSLNEVLAKICNQKGIKIAIEIDKIINKTEKEKAKALARLKQNIMLAKKAEVKLVFITEKPENKAKTSNLKSLLLTLGADTKQASQAEFVF